MVVAATVTHECAVQHVSGRAKLAGGFDTGENGYDDFAQSGVLRGGFSVSLSPSARPAALTRSDERAGPKAAR